jgi:hypothetical protein
MLYLAKFGYSASGPVDPELGAAGRYLGTLNAMCAATTADRALESFRQLFRDMLKSDPDFTGRKMSVHFEHMVQIERLPSTPCLLSYEENVDPPGQQIQGFVGSGMSKGKGEAFRTFFYHPEGLTEFPAFADYDGEGGIGFDTGFKDGNVDTEEGDFIET